MHPEKTDKGRGCLEMKFVRNLIYGQLRGHDMAFGTDENRFVNPGLDRIIRDGFDDRREIFR